MYVFLGMVALTFLDVVLRTTIDRPISGTIEITELLMVVMFFGSVAHAQWNHAHVNMDIITSRLSKTGENRLGFATDLWSLVIVVFCIKTMIDYAFKSSTLVTPDLAYPFPALHSVCGRRMRAHCDCAAARRADQTCGRP